MIRILFFLRCFRFCGFWRGLGLSGFEFLHSAGGVYDFLVAGEKRMAGAANFHMEFLAGAASGKGIAASANNFGFSKIGWVEVLFHISRRIITRSEGFDKGVLLVMISKRRPI